MTRAPHFADIDYRARQRRLHRLLEEHKIDALLVSHLPNIRYLCGFTGSAALLLLTREHATFFSDGRYRVQAQEEVRGAKVVLPHGPILQAAAQAAARLHTLGIEADHMTVATRDRLTRVLRSRTRVRSLSGVVESLRMIKEAAEIERIRAAVLLGSRLFDRLVRRIRPGVIEQDLSADLEHAARRAGAESMSFETIVASGPRSAMPHGRASSQALPRRGFVVLDFGVILAGYCSDMTRTLYLGRPGVSACRMYEAVLEAQEAAIDAVRPGAAVGEVDRAARCVLRRLRMDKYFTHSTGHGVGQEIHEPPRVAHGEREVLRPGMVITIEPGVYVAGQGGVRIEDMVVVTEDGHHVLTPTSKELIAL